MKPDETHGKEKPMEMKMIAELDEDQLKEICGGVCTVVTMSGGTQSLAYGGTGTVATMESGTQNGFCGSTWQLNSGV